MYFLCLEPHPHPTPASHGLLCPQSLIITTLPPNSQVNLTAPRFICAYVVCVHVRMCVRARADMCVQMRVGMHGRPVVGISCLPQSLATFFFESGCDAEY